MTTPITGQGINVCIPPDDALSITSKKAVQNKVVAAGLNVKQDKPQTEGTAGQVLALDDNLNPVWANQSGGGGTTDYAQLSNKPTINNVELSGNKTLAALGINAGSIGFDETETYTDGSVGKELSDQKNAIDSLGAIDDIEFSESGYLTTLGVFKPHPGGSKTTDYIEVTDIVTLQVRVLFLTSIGVVCYYDEDKEFIDKLTGIDNNTYYEGVPTLPTGTKYVRVCKWSAADSSVYAKLSSDLSPELMIENEKRIEILENVEYLDGSCDADFDTNGFLNTYGIITANAGFKATEEYINIEQCDKIKYTGKVASSFAAVVYYNRDFKPLDIVKGSSTTAEEVTLEINSANFPEGTVYVRFSTNIGGSYTRYSAKICYETKALNWLCGKESFEVFSENKKNKYPHSVAKPFSFNGKTAVVFGDSIAYGVYSTSTGTVLTKTQSFIDLFATDMGITLDNQAVSGTTISNNGYRYSILNKIKAYADYATTDIIFVAGGTNDYNQSISIGELDSSDNTKFFGALNEICEYIHTNASNAIVIFISPIPYTDVYFEKRNAAGALTSPIKYGNNAGHVLNDYRNAIYEVATQYGYNVVNGGLLGMPEGSGGGWNNIMCSDADGCHPTILGHHLYAHNLAGVLL